VLAPAALAALLINRRLPELPAHRRQLFGGDERAAGSAIWSLSVS
jgi:hypothetical protein